MKKLKNKNHPLFSDLSQRFHDESIIRCLTYDDEALDFFFEMLDECVNNCYSVDNRLLSNRVKWAHRKICSFLDHIYRWYNEGLEEPLHVEEWMLEKSVIHLNNYPPLFLYVGRAGKLAYKKHLRTYAR